MAALLRAWFKRNETAATTAKVEAETEKIEAETESLEGESYRALIVALRSAMRDYRKELKRCSDDRKVLHEASTRQEAAIDALTAAQKKHDAERAADRSIIDGLRTRMGKLETALTLLGKDPKLVS